MLKHGEFQGQTKGKKEPDAHWVPGIRTSSTARAVRRMIASLGCATHTTRNKMRSGKASRINDDGHESEPRGVIGPASMAHSRGGSNDTSDGKPE
jgi:hypothetical protein